MNSPEPLNRLSVFRRLGSYLGQQWGLGIQVVTDGVASRPLAIGDGFALSAFHEECISITALNDEHDEALSSIPSSKDAQILEHPAGFQMLAVSCPIPRRRTYLVLAPFAVSEELNERKARLSDYLSKAGLPVKSARKVANALQTIDRRDLQHVSDLAGILAEEAAHYAKRQRDGERRLSNLQRRHRENYSRLIGKSLPMMEMFSMLDKIVDSDSSVYIHGENGTGKELVAREIHEHSRRADAPFLAQNCSALNDNLLESEIFGHVRGAFTGAVTNKPGLFSLADGGTFFLDEIGDMSSSLQVKLLRVIQEGTFLPVGDTKFRKVDVRIICATNRNLEQMVKDGRFREDLYYRINVISLRIPPLRERRDDIQHLTEFFLERAHAISDSPSGQKHLSKETMRRLTEYEWPGNVRELENEIERLLVLAGTLSSKIDDDLLSPHIRCQPLRLPSEKGSKASLPNAVERLEREMILEYLRKNRWNKTRTATALGISRRNLIRKVEKYGFDRRSR